MSITVECAACKSSYAVDEKFVGRMVTCKNCGTLFRIEAAAPSPPPGIDPFANASFVAPAKSKLPPPPNPKWRNPIETNAISDPAGEENAPVIRDQKPLAKAFAFDAATPYILLLLVGTSIAFGAYWTLRINVANSQALHASADPVVGKTAIETLWLTIALFNFLFFVVVTPLMMLGVWASTRVLKFPMVNSAYLRMSGVAAPVTLFLAAYRLDGIQYPYALLLLLLLPAVFFMLKLMLKEDWAAAGLSFALASVGFAIGFFILKTGCEIIVPPTTKSPVRMAFYPPPPESRPPTSVAVTDTGPPVSDSATAPAPATREAPGPLPQSTGQKVTVTPAVPDVYTAPMDGSIPDWTTVVQLSGAKLGPEVSFKKFKFRPPRNMSMDLNSSEDGPAGLVWKGPSASRLSIYTRPRNDPRQIKPVVTDNNSDERVTEKAGMLTVNRSNVTVSYGQLDGVLFTKIENSSELAGDHSTQFIGPFDDVWLIVDFTTPAGDPNFTAVLGAAARTVRQIEPGEERSDPLAANVIAPRLLDDYDHVASLLRSQGSAAEDALTGLLLKSKDGPMRMKALELLKEIATERSLPALRRAAKDADAAIAGLAQEVVQRIHPGEALPTPGPAGR